MLPPVLVSLNLFRIGPPHGPMLKMKENNYWNVIVALWLA
jgi:hypothetical protein